VEWRAGNEWIWNFTMGSQKVSGDEVSGDVCTAM
jgi:hypothetical protein